MKIVMINDCCHVGASLATELRNMGCEVPHILRSRGIFSKTFGIAWNILSSGDADIYHVHYALQDAFLASIFKRLDLLHCHGSDVRWEIDGSWGRMIRSNLKNARKVLVSTPDILNRALDFNETAEYLPNPIDTDAFKPQEKIESVDKPKALYFTLRYEELPQELESALVDAGFVFEKVQGKPFRYEEMPNILSHYDVFIDRFTIESFSKTCLEAMSCGLATITYKDKDDFRDRVDDLTDARKRLEERRTNRYFIMENHDAKKITEKLLKIYDSLLK